MFMFFSWPNLECEGEEMRVKRRRLRDNTNVLDLPKEEFHKQFRVNKEVFKQILHEIGPRMQRRIRSTAIPEITKLACFMRTLAGDHQTRLGENTSVSQPTVSMINAECLEIFENYFCSKWINLNVTKEEATKIKADFYGTTQLPDVLGCADCTHIAIACPRAENRDLYENKSGSYSINALMICDANLTVRYIDATQPGSNEDAFVWNNSNANAYFKSRYDAGKKDFRILGDADFELHPYFMTPYKNPTKRHELVYNKKLLLAQQITKNFIHALKNRFRCISGKKTLYYSPEKTTKLINVCCALHNACLFYKDDLLLKDNELSNMHCDEAEDSESTDERWDDNEIRPTDEAIENRRKLAKSISDEDV